METQELECGHRQPVESGTRAVWCPIHNEMTLVVEPSEPARAGTVAAAAARRPVHVRSGSH
ncbi:MAG: hypothetical protein DLM58_23410 [Pseudonocardiales bacterium]|nr:MAG: hypothetical protein DLM58_23410 [Pseudonocardiales bacterium]